MPRRSTCPCPRPKARSSLLAATLLAAAAALAGPTTVPALVRSVASGPWSAPATWDGGRVPAAGDRVLVRAGDRVVYDVNSDAALYAVHVAGTLDFATDRDTRLDVGLLLIQPGDDGSGDDARADFLGDAHGTRGQHVMTDAMDMTHAKSAPPAALRVGSATQPVQAGRTALIRLTKPPAADAKAFPALVCMGGTLDLHGSPLARSWVKLRDHARAGDRTVTLNEPVPGWAPGDRLVIPTCTRPAMFTGDGRVIPHVTEGTQTEERTIVAIDGQLVTLDRPLAYDHAAPDEFRGEVANLSRNIVIESADPDSADGALRGHTMVHPHARATLAYAEFRRLGKPGVLGRYPLHFHSAGDSLRGSSVVGCSVWDSGNRFLTLHGTDYFVVRDTVGYKSRGHGFFLEDGTETYNVFDRNLAIQALKADPPAGQVLPFDHNDGAGFWWANSHNTFTNNVAADCDQYGYRFEMAKPPAFDPRLPVRKPDGTAANVDVRTLPFVRFENNEAHSMRRYAVNLGGFRFVAGNDDYTAAPDGTRKFDPAKALVGDVGDVGPDLKHPFHVRDLKVWRSFWVFHSAAPSVYLDGLTSVDNAYGIWRSRSDHAQYKNLSFRRTEVADVFNPWGGAADFTKDFNQSIRPVDDSPPQTVITAIVRTGFGDLRVTGTTSDNGRVARVMVNGVAARATAANFLEWSVDVPDAPSVTATATDVAGNAEQTPHTRAVAGDGGIPK